MNVTTQITVENILDEKLLIYGKVGLGDISHAICMRISSVKPVS